MTPRQSALIHRLRGFLPRPSEYLKGDSAAGGIALINTIGLCGGFLSPIIIGWTKTLSGSTELGLITMSGLPAIGAVLLALINRKSPASCILE